MLRAVAVVVVFLALVAAEGPSDADVYSYTDNDGVVHFTNLAPRGNTRKKWKKVLKGSPEMGPIRLSPEFREELGEPVKKRYDRYVKAAGKNIGEIEMFS